MDKTKDMNSTMSFIGSQQVLIMHKLDGLAVKLEYENGSLVRASTRGNGEEAKSLPITLMPSKANDFFIAKAS